MRTSFAPNLLAIFTSLWISTLAGFAATVTLAWDPSPSSNVVDYTIYVGGQSRTYTNRVSVGNVTSTTISGLAAGNQYFFAATASDDLGFESELSTEVSYVVPDSGTVSVITVSATDGSAGEPGTGLGSATLTFLRSGSLTTELAVSLSVGGTAQPGVDYSALDSTIVFPAGVSSVTRVLAVLDDWVVEGGETVSVSLVAGPGYSLGSPATALIAIADDDTVPIIDVSATDALAGEPGTAKGNGAFTLTRTGPVVSALDVNIGVGGTGAPGIDYAALGTVVSFPAGVSNVVMPVTVLDDSSPEQEETVVISLLGGTGYTVGNSSTAVVTIGDDDSIDLAAALDISGLGWTTANGVPAWYGQTLSSWDGSDAARSGAIGDGQVTWMETTVTGRGTVTFWWRVSSEPNGDFARFYINGVLQASRSGEGVWAQASYALGNGSQRLRWEYSKNASLRSGEDAAWVDQVTWTPRKNNPRYSSGIPFALPPLELIMDRNPLGVFLHWLTEDGVRYGIEATSDEGQTWSEVYQMYGDGQVRTWQILPDQQTLRFRASARYEE